VPSCLTQLRPTIHSTHNLRCQSAPIKSEQLSTCCCGITAWDRHCYKRNGHCAEDARRGWDYANTAMQHRPHSDCALHSRGLCSCVLARPTEGDECDCTRLYLHCDCPCKLPSCLTQTHTHTYTHTHTQPKILRLPRVKNRLAQTIENLFFESHTQGLPCSKSTCIHSCAFHRTGTDNMTIIYLHTQLCVS